jgi:ABC-2 type transport system ATP-binding protein
MPPGPSAGEALHARDLVKTYPGDVRALDGLSFTVPSGTVFGLLGPNGAGKSTTVKILTTLALPDSGTAYVAGHDVLRRPDEVRRAIGCVAQRSGSIPEATGRENLVLQGQVYGMSGRALNSRVDELLERFDLADAARRLVRTYSGGMQRRLEIAMGLVHRPQVLFLDEPSTGLDPEARAGLWEEIDRLAHTDGLSILLTTHYLDEADRLASRLAIVERGRVVVEGSPDELKGELRGDAVQVELTDQPSGATGHPEPSELSTKDAREVGALVRRALDRVDGIGEVTVDGRTLRARAERGATAVPAVLAALESHGLRAASVTVARPSLDDVYLRHVGRTFSHDDKEVAR